MVAYQLDDLAELNGVQDHVGGRDGGVVEARNSGNVFAQCIFAQQVANRRGGQLDLAGQQPVADTDLAFAGAHELMADPLSDCSDATGQQIQVSCLHWFCPCCARRRAESASMRSARAA